MAERERDPDILRIPDAVCEKGVQSTWGLGNQMFVFPRKKPEINTDIPDGPVQIHEVRWETDMHGPITRKLVNESHNQFVILQQAAKEKSGSALKPILVMASKKYRSVLKACSEDHYSLSGSIRDDVQQGMYEEPLQLFAMTELIWSLCEILFVDVTPGGIVISQLLVWLKSHFTDGQRRTAEVLRHEQPESHPEYWSCVYRLVLQGQTDQARMLLNIHPSKSSPAHVSIDEMLKKMPLYSQLFRGSSVSEFDMKWRHWRDDCERRVQEGHFANNGCLDIVAKILCGEDEIFSNLKDLCETWYCMLVSKMLYQNPTVKSVDLQYYVQGCVDEYRGERLGVLDSILLSALEFDIHQVINVACAGLSHSWFVAHLTDLLHHSGQLESHRLEFGSNLREYLLLEYASSLMSHRSLWQVGVDYLDHCTEFGRKYLEHFIEHMPIETEKKAQKLLTICNKRGMTEQVKIICKVMGMRAIKNSRLGSALSWFLRSKDVAFATLIAEKYLSEYSDQGHFSNLDLIDNLGSSMVLSSRLTFLGKYRDFHRLYEDKEFHAAGSLLLSLLASRLAPREFWITLLKDAIALLEAKELIFGSKETYEVMHCLEELIKDTTHLGTGKPDDDFADLKDTIELLNLALTRNLARAIVIEGTVKPT